MSEQQSVVGVFIIATLKYKQFLQPLLYSIEKNFLPNNKLVVHIFTDEFGEYITSERIKIRQYFIESYKFPYATLLRYKIFCQNVMLSNEDYLFYIDADMRVNDPVNEEILNEITVVSHPGFFSNNGWGSPNVDPRSTAYFEPERRWHYVCGGFNGGSRKEFMKICNILAHHIDIDEENGVRAEWNDESHLNKLISTMEDRSKVTILDSSYCQPEQEHLQVAWHIDHLPKRIMALAKNHTEIRS